VTAKRLFDIAVAAVGLVVTSPILAVAGVAVRLSSKGPVLFRAPRAGRGGKVFVLHKVRTMESETSPAGPRVTAPTDQRIFPVGHFLRATKIDELPQLLDVLQGHMSIVGPRPEDPRIVEQHITEAQRETLDVAPGLLGPGSIFNYTHGDRYLSDDDTEDAYVTELLPLKLALDAAYIRHASVGYDLRLTVRALRTIAAKLVGVRSFADPPEMTEAVHILQEWNIR
jgi:lipopolysaccharide/colanic/teichoic acid biosynthesis glycosyltransferase